MKLIVRDCNGNYTIIFPTLYDICTNKLFKENLYREDKTDALYKQNIEESYRSAFAVILVCAHLICTIFFYPNKNDNIKINISLAYI